MGIGPSAHSFLNGERFYYPRDLKAFIKGNKPINDGSGGELEEQIMLGLMLKKGVQNELLSTDAVKKCQLFAENGLGIFKTGSYSLTNKGMLLSNSIITEILEVL